MGSRLRQVEGELRIQRDASKRLEILANIREWRRHEEVMWWQQSRVDYLNYGKSNTKRFHSKASMTKVRNHISKLIDGDGVAHTDPRKISDIVIEYFSELLTGRHNPEMDAVIECIQPRGTTEMNDSFCAPYTKEEIEKALA